MPLQFIGIDPHTGDEKSPTVWVDLERQMFVFQGWQADAETNAECAEFEVPGHAIGIPPGEAVIRIPAHMASMIREACDVLERSAAAVH